MHAQDPPAPPAPLPPSVPAQIATPQEFLPPTNRPEVEALRKTREELSDQLISAQARRGEIAQELIGADPGARAGLQARLEVLDARIVQLEQDIAYTGRLLTSPEATLAMTETGPQPFGPLDSDQITGISIVFIVLVLFPLALAATRLMWKRARSARALPNTVDSERLERVEHAVETIAIEVERISEGQRFVTKLLARPDGVAIAEPEPLKSVRGSGGPSTGR